MAEFEIEKNVPLPSGHGRWAFVKDMEVGDSFLILDKCASQKIKQYCVYNNLPDMQFASRTQHNGETRIWRIK